MRALPVFLFVFISFFSINSLVIAQGHSFPYGQATYRELDMKIYEPDTSAVALMLDEFGEAYFDNNNDHNLLFEYHARIKILKKGGVSFGTFEIPLRKSEGRSDRKSVV